MTLPLHCICYTTECTVHHIIQCSDGHKVVYLNTEDYTEVSCTARNIYVRNVDVNTSTDTATDIQRTARCTAVNKVDARSVDYKHPDMAGTIRHMLPATVATKINTSCTCERNKKKAGGYPAPCAYEVSFHVENAVIKARP
jgi:hypothetical protein